MMLFNTEEIIEKTFNLKADVEGYVEETTDWGETQTELVDKYTDMPCTVSQGVSRNITRMTANSEIEYDIVLFYPADKVINAGDKVTIHYNKEAKRTFEAGEGYFFSDHCEIPLVKEGES
ncbi:hypothetical protein [Salsuginibacillus kocurii]|uniref:hypothetical protein n=1 Tax=Salsuginibacillus kocurii TaxID=427078 RepID=UPI000375C7D5|nr:hypothetical protein [Salsuginibacillus kocurii]